MTLSGKKICIVGTGGSGRETLCCLIDSLAGTGRKISDAACFMVGDEYYAVEELMGIKVIRQSAFNPAKYDVVVAIGDPADRRKVVESLPDLTTYATIIHPSVIISSFVAIGKGSVITAGSILTCQIEIGKHAQLNLNTTIGHDLIAGDYFTTAQGVNISGRCVFGNGIYFGANASVRQGISICDDVTIGMGAVVVKDITEPGIYIGNPARKM
jgi:sugar O-acyltransferase (sialic acid O-acetyltransferase NeuD family)